MATPKKTVKEIVTSKVMSTIESYPVKTKAEQTLKDNLVKAIELALETKRNSSAKIKTVDNVEYVLDSYLGKYFPATFFSKRTVKLKNDETVLRFASMTRESSKLKNANAKYEAETIAKIADIAINSKDKDKEKQMKLLQSEMANYLEESKLKLIEKLENTK